MTHFSGDLVPALRAAQAAAAASRASETYANFGQLLEHHHEFVDFSRTAHFRFSSLAIIAPHGGAIEPGTEFIAHYLAGSELSYYIFQDLRSQPKPSLHITSNRFDDPVCLGLCAASEKIVTIHGCLGSYEALYVGGLDQGLGAKISTIAATYGIRTDQDRVHPGKNPKNICNRGTSTQGVQLEFTQGLRDAILHDKHRDFLQTLRHLLLETAHLTLPPKP